METLSRVVQMMAALLGSLLMLAFTLALWGLMKVGGVVMAPAGLVAGIAFGKPPQESADVRVVDVPNKAR